MITKSFKRALVFAMAAVILCTASCGKNGKNGKSGEAGDAREKTAMVYPLVEECCYNNLDELIRRTEYAYSPEGYLLSERTWSYYYVKDFDGGENYSSEYNSSYLYGETDVNTYRYDQAGRLVEEYNGYHFDDGSKGLHYRKYTAAYAYDDKGRRTGTKEIIRDYTVNDPLKGFHDDNMTQDSEETTDSECVITDNPETGGWKSLETFTFSGDYACYSGETVEMEYEADGRLLSRTKTVPAIECVYTARYEYDEKGRPVSAHIRTHDFDDVETAYSRIAVAYNEDSHMVRKTVDADSDIIDEPFAFAIQCEYDELGRLTKRQRSLGGETGCIETVTYSDDGTAVRDHIYPDWSEETDWLQNEETVYADPDENGNYHTLFKYVLEGQDRDFYQKITRQYGEAIPSGVKYGTSGILADEESVSPVHHNFDLGIANEYLYYGFDETDALYDTF